MIDLYKVGENPYEDKKISVSDLTAFTEEHVGLVLADPVAASVALELTAVSNGMDALDTNLGSETVKLGLRKARVAAKNQFRAALPNEISKVYGAPLIAFGQDGVELLEIFPNGREVFSTADDSQLETHLSALNTAMLARAAELDATAVALSTTLLTNWQTIYGDTITAKGQKTSAAETRRQGAAALKVALGKLRLRLGLGLFGQIDRLKGLFPQALLGFPLETVPAPGVLQITSVEVVDVTTARINTPATGGAEGATEIVVQWKLASETAWANEVLLTRPTQTITDPDFEQATIDFRIVTRNSGGETISEVVTLAM